jgi:hypothetical protein
VTWSNYNHDYARIDTTLIRYYGEITEITPLSNFRRLQIREIRDPRENLIGETRLLRRKHASWCDWVYDENSDKIIKRIVISCIDYNCTVSI